MKQEKSTIQDKAERGQSLVELAISLIFILFLLLGAVEFSLALFQYVTIRDAAQEGVVYGSINPDNVTEIKSRVIDAASDVVQLTEDDVDVDWTNGPSKKCEGLTSSVPNALTVTVTFDHPITFPLVAPMIGTNTIALTANVTNTILSPTCP